MAAESQTFDWWLLYQYQAILTSNWINSIMILCNQNIENRITVSGRGYWRLNQAFCGEACNFKDRVVTSKTGLWFIFEVLDSILGNQSFEYKNNSLMRLLLTSQSKLSWSHPISLIALLFHFICSIYYNLWCSPLVYVLIYSFLFLEYKPLMRKDLPNLFTLI